MRQGELNAQILPIDWGLFEQGVQLAQEPHGDEHAKILRQIGRRRLVGGTEHFLQLVDRQGESLAGELNGVAHRLLARAGLVFVEKIKTRVQLDAVVQVQSQNPGVSAKKL